MIRATALIAGLMLATLSAALLAYESASAQGAGVSCLGVPATIQGTQGDDTIVGTEGDDSIYAFGGNDVVDGRGGNDRICVSEGVNVAQGGQGDDVIEGGPQDDFLVGDLINGPQEYGSGADDIRGGLGPDVVVGDSASDSGGAAGQGDDKVSGGPGDANDIVIGDAYSKTFAVGTGDDDLDSGPGTDIVVGDAMVGNPTSAGARDSAPRQTSGPVGALGFGGDTVNSQTEDDLVVGDAMNWNRPDGTRGLFAGIFSEVASAYCGRKLARQIAFLDYLGFNAAEVDDIVTDILKSEFGEDFTIGDCIAWFGSAQGADPDQLNAGTENDLTVGDNAAGGAASGGQPGVESHLGGKGNDAMAGDHLTVQDLANAAVLEFGTRILTDDFIAIQLDGVPRVFPISMPYESLWHETYMVNVFPNGAPDRAATAGSRQGTVEGGGKDHVRGGQGDDYIEGGVKKDKCSGGPGIDEFSEKGISKCEDITGDP